MRIEINPRSLLNLENICEVLYKLHPSVLDYLIEMERSWGDILGVIDLNNLSLKEREFLSRHAQEEDKGVKVTTKTFDNREDAIKCLNEYKSNNPNVKILNEYKSNNPNVKILNEDEDEDEEFKKQLKKFKNKYFNENQLNSEHFHNLRKYLQLDTDEYIPMKIYVEVEDPVIGKKVKELVEALEKTRAPEQFYFHKKEVDEDAYFAEGYGLTMNEEQEKQRDDFFWGEDVEGLKELLIKEKLYP